MGESRTGRGGHDLPDAVVQVAELRKLSEGWNSEELVASIAAQQDRFTKECLDSGRCLDAEPLRALFILAMEASNLASAARVAGAFVGMRNAISRYVTASYLHARLLRCRAKAARGEALYAVHLGPMAYVACTAIAINADEEARWLAAELLRHLDAGRECTYTSDTAFIAGAAWICRWHLSCDPPPTSPILGDYLRFVQALDDPGSPLQKSEELLQVRTANAYRLLVLRDESQALFYRDQFVAMFPFEVLAFLRLAERATGVEMQPRHPIVAGVWPELRGAASWSDAFVQGCKAKLDQLDASLGLG